VIPLYVRQACGILTRTVVPFPGAALIMTSPPNTSALSCIPRIPSDLVRESLSMRIPLPLSWTKRISSLSFSPSSILTSLAAACRTTFVRLSCRMRKIAVARSGVMAIFSRGSPNGI